MLRFLNVSKLKSHLLEKFGMLSIIQLNAQLKLEKVWKALNIVNYPIKCFKKPNGPDVISTRAKTSGRLIEPGIKTLATKTCLSDVVRLWNFAPLAITESKTIYSAKKAITVFAK